MTVTTRALLVAGAFLLMGAGDSSPLTALSRIEAGEWSLRTLGQRAAPRRICVGDARSLLQLQHPNVACSRYVIANESSSTTVHYTCPGAGHGRTTVSVETPRLIRIESQGIAGAAPFDWAMEARKSGACRTAAAR